MRDMLVFCVGVLFMVGIVANAEQCRYEFVVPEGNCRSNPAPDEEAQSIMHVHSSIDMTNERLTSMAQEFTKQLTLLDADSKQFKEVTGVLESKLATVQENLAELKGMKDDVLALKKSLTDTSNSLNPKVEALTDKMVNIASQFTEQSEVYSKIQQQLAETAKTAGKQSQDIDALKHTAETLQDLMKKAGLTSDGNQGLGEIRARIDSIEDKVAQGSSSGDTINRLKSAVNLLQSELLSTAHQYRSQIQMLAGTVNTLTSEMETLKKSVQVK